MNNEQIKPGDLCRILSEDEAWNVSSAKYEDWLSFDKKHQDELVLVLEVRISLFAGNTVLVTNESGIFFISSKFLKKL